MFSFLVNTCLVVFPHVFKDSLDYFVVLFFWSSMIWPCQILQLSHYSSFTRLPFWIHNPQLHLSFDKIRHQWFDRNQIYFLIAVEYNALLQIILLDLCRPVLMTLDFCMLLRMSQHYDERDSLLINHAPEVLYSWFKWTLSCYEELIITWRGSINIVGIDVWIVNVFVSLE